MTAKTKLFIFLGLFVLALTLTLFIDQTKLSILLEKIIFNAV